MIAAGWPLFIISVIVCSVVFFCSDFLAKKTLLADRPNARSSHSEPVSRAGGVAIIVAWGVGLLLANWLVQGFAANVAFLILVIFAAILGLLDDAYQLKPVVKFSGQLLLALIFITTIGIVSRVPMPFFGDVSLGFFAIPLNIFWILGMANAYNFMDGLNGIAAGVGALVLLVIAIIAVPFEQNSVVVMAFLMAAALCAFLPHNLLRGKLFMGDVGSQSVSFAIAGFAILLSKGDSPVLSALFVPVLMLPFIADVTFTLIHRLLRKQRLTQAHREHVYQLLMRQGLSHGEVTGLYIGATALCAAAAILMLGIPQAWQWLVPLGLMVPMLGIGKIVYMRAKNIGLLSQAGLPEDADPQAQDSSVSQPAE